MTAIDSDRPSGVFVDVPWALEEHHVAWRKNMRGLCEDLVRPNAAARDRARAFDVELVAELGELGLFGLLIPEEHGGSGADVRSLCIAGVELARVDSSVAVTVHVQAIVTALFHHAANDAQRERWLPSMARGSSFVAIGLTEPTGGSDAANPSTVARRDGSGWRVSGAKQFITNSGTPMSDNVIVFAATGRRPNGRAEVTAFLMPLDERGVTELVMNCLAPLTRQPDPSRRATVLGLAASEPPVGSVNPIATKLEPRAMEGNQRSR